MLFKEKLPVDLHQARYKINFFFKSVNTTVIFFFLVKFLRNSILKHFILFEFFTNDNLYEKFFYDYVFSEQKH